MLLQTDLLDEIQVGIKDLLWGMVAEHTDEQGHDALHDQRVALGREMDLAVGIVCLQPHTTLATVDQILLRLVLLVKGRLLTAQVDE